MNTLRRIAARWRTVPTRTRLGVLAAVIALAGLGWQHYAARTADPAPAAVAAEHSHHHDGEMLADSDGHAHCEYQLPEDHSPTAPSGTGAFSVDAARQVVTRFAGHFAAPGGDRDSWLARISPDVVPDLLAQYQFTDIRNVPTATVTEVSGPLTRMPGSMTFEVAYSDANRVAVGVELGESTWQVATVVPLPAAPPAGTVGETGGADARAPSAGAAAETVPAAAPDGQR